jgi:hypothetical protein
MSVFGISKTRTNTAKYSSMCNFEFVHPRVINIKQLSFTSCLYVLAYRISGLAPH